MKKKISTRFSKYQGVELLDHMGRVFLVLSETFKLWKEAAPFCIPICNE
jgi:hypothetical protein